MHILLKSSFHRIWSALYESTAVLHAVARAHEDRTTAETVDVLDSDKVIKTAIHELLSARHPPPPHIFEDYVECAQCGEPTFVYECESRCPSCSLNVVYGVL